MTDVTSRYAPSAAARAFLSDPANRDTRVIGASDFTALRAEGHAEALARVPALAAKWGVTIGETQIAGRRCAKVTPADPRTDLLNLYVFGGGFVMGGPLEDLPIIAALAAQTRIRVIAPYYRLAPEDPWPAGVEDVCAVARALADRGPLILSGESAGGNLALVATQELASSGAPAPAALALLSPAVDLGGPADEGPDDPTLSPAMRELVHRAYMPDADPADPRISPLRGTFGPDWPPTLITTGTNDRLLSGCTRLARAIRASGAMADLRVWDGMWHVFEWYEGIPEADASLREIADFITATAGAEMP